MSAADMVNTLARICLQDFDEEGAVPVTAFVTDVCCWARAGVIWTPFFSFLKLDVSPTH